MLIFLLLVICFLQRCSSKIFIVSFVPFPPKVAEEIHFDEVNRSLCGGLEILGIFDDSECSAVEQRKLVWKIFGKRARGLNDVYVCVRNKKGALSFSKYWTGEDWNKDAVVAPSSAVGEMKFSVVVARAPMVFNVPVIPGETVTGQALEKAVEEFCGVVERDVFVGKVVQNECQLWTKVRGPITCTKACSTYFEYRGEVAAVVVVSKDCKEEEVVRMVKDDLKKTIRVRTAILLDEMEQLQEESVNPQEEHALSRYKSVACASGTKWTLPRRVVIRDERSMVPFVDYQLVGEFEGRQTMERAKDTLGFSKVQIHAVEKVPPKVSFQTGTSSKSSSMGTKVATQKRDQASKQINPAKMWLLSVGGALVVLLVSIIILRLQ